MIEIAPAASAILAADPRGSSRAFRAALASSAGIAADALELSDLQHLPSGAALLTIDGEGANMRALHTLAERRGTNVAEAVHAAVHAHLDP